MKLSSLNKGLVGHWPLDEQSFNPATKRFTDKTPNENHGTSANAPVFTTDRMGQADRAMSFDGASDYVDCGNDASLDITEAITILAWIFPIGWGEGGVGRIVEKSYLSSYCFGNYNGKLSFASINAGINISSNINSLELNKWQHVVITYNKVYIRFYVDGVYAGGGAKTASLGTDNNALYVGNNATINRTFDGSIADVRIYNRALSETEIGMLYENYRSKVII